jgi:hypothetical protein
MEVVGHNFFFFLSEGGRYNTFFIMLYCDNIDSAIVFTTGRLPDVNPT